MRVSRVLIDLARVEALDVPKSVLDGEHGKPPNFRVVVLDGAEPLPAIAASDPRAFGCIVGHDDVGAVTFRAMHFELVGHATPPLDSCASVERPLRSA